MMASGSPLQHESVPVRLDTTPGLRVWYLKPTRDGGKSRHGPYEVVGTGKQHRSNHEMVVCKLADSVGRQTAEDVLIMSLIEFADHFEICKE